MKGQFSQFVKEHYASVKHLPAKERMKKLAEQYKLRSNGGAKGGAKGGAETEELSPLQNVRKEDVLVPIHKNMRRRTRSRVRGGVVGGELGGAETDIVSKVKPKEKEYKLPVSLVPPSVPVDRSLEMSKQTGVPGPFYSGLPNYNPHEESIAKQRKFTQPSMKQTQGAYIRQGATGGKDETDLKTLLKMYGVSMPKYMRNVPQGGALTKRNYSKLFKHVMDTHGEKGAGLFDSLSNVLSSFPFRK